MGDRPDGPAIAQAVEEYGNTLFKLCLIQLGHEQDAYDMVQETFLRYLDKAPLFHEKAHQKAWLLKVALNLCRDRQRYDRRHRHIDIDELRDYAKVEEHLGILELLMSMPPPYKTALHLFYVERYDVKSISEMTGLSVSAVKKHLQRGRARIKREQEGCDNHERIQTL